MFAHRRGDAGVWLCIVARHLTVGIALRPHPSYICGAGLTDYGDKRRWNKRSGPGGGTRRLHQISGTAGVYGGETRIDARGKGYLSPGMIPPLSGHNLSANDNFAPEALAA